MSGEKSCNSYISATKKACSGNNNGYIYALVDLPQKGTVEMLSYSEDKKYYLNDKNVQYIGVTNNPISRFQAHRTKKGKKVGMVIFDEARNPAEGKYLESKAIYNFCELKGKGPKLQKGHDTWAGA